MFQISIWGAKPPRGDGTGCYASLNRVLRLPIFARDHNQ